VIKQFLSLFLVTSLFSYDLGIEEVNILTSKYDYNRLRGKLNIEKNDFLFKLLADNENIYNYEEKLSSNTNRIYRMYLQYSDDKNLFIIGKQRVFLGVGRMFNPIDVFNPIDITAIESSQRKGVESIRYDYAINDLSNISFVSSEDKRVVKLKGFLEVGDFGVIFIRDEEFKKDILGFEAEGEIQGITFRSEIKVEKEVDYIVGSEYGFENGFNLLFEYRNSTNELGSVMSYPINLLTTINITAIKNLKYKSWFTLLNVDYSLTDDIDISLGGLIYSDEEDVLFLKLFMEF
jgi:hypothetical protein